MIIFIPMAGLSARFTKEGYTLPKYMLFAGNQSLFRIAVSSFKTHFETATFVFIYRNIFDTKSFITAECNVLGIKHVELVEIDQPTKGQAETVKIGIDHLLQKGIDNEMIVFNADTAKTNFVLPDFIKSTDGYLEVFEGEGEHWSFVQPLAGLQNRVERTTEKVRISNLCSNGLYHFTSMQLFMDAYQASFYNQVHNGEYYIAPMYNALIAQQKKIHYFVLPKSEMLLFGTPVEYIQFVKSVIQ
jgi:hypothetical protein